MPETLSGALARTFSAPCFQKKSADDFDNRALTACRHGIPNTTPVLSRSQMHRSGGMLDCANACL
jgi:hypothetical protein